MISHSEFKFLTYSKQVAYLLARGHYLATRLTDSYKINLYHLSTFFAEAWHDKTTDKIETIGTYSNNDCLENYTEVITYKLP